MTPRLFEAVSRSMVTPLRAPPAKAAPEVAVVPAPDAGRAPAPAPSRAPSEPEDPGRARLSSSSCAARSLLAVSGAAARSKIDGPSLPLAPPACGYPAFAESAAALEATLVGLLGPGCREEVRALIANAQGRGPDPSGLTPAAALFTVNALLERVAERLASVGPIARGPSPLESQAALLRPLDGAIFSNAQGVLQTLAPECGVAPPAPASPAVGAALKQGGSKKGHDAAREVARDPKLIATASPDEKAQLIKNLMEGWTKDKDDRAILDILESCKSKAEFDHVLDKAGGKKVLEEIDHDDTKEKINMLAGMWGRTDVATDMKAAKKAEGELLKPSSDLFVMSGPRRAPGDESDARIQARAYGDVDPKTRAETIMENAKRRADGKPLMDLGDLTSRIEEIRLRTDLSKDEREKEIERLRKEMGLGEDAMRDLGTQRMGQIYAVTAAETGDARLAEVGEHLKGLYPVPPSFWESFAGFFGKLFDWVAPLLNLIPGVGSALYAGYMGVKLGIGIASGDVGGIVGSVAGMLGPIGGAVSGVAGQAINAAGKIVQGGMGVARGVDAAIHGDVLGAISGLGGGVVSGLGTAGVDAGTIEGVSKGIGIGTSGAQIAVGVVTGDADRALGGLAGVTGSVRELAGPKALGAAGDRVLGLVDQGLQFGRNLANGSFGAALGQVGAGFGDPTLASFASHADVFSKLPPSVRDLASSGATFFGSVADGRAFDAIDALGKGVAPVFGGETASVLRQSAGAVRALVNRDVVSLHGALTAGIEGGKPLIESLAGGAFSRALGGLSAEASRALADPGVAQALSVLSEGGKFVEGVITGDVEKRLRELGPAGAQALSVVESVRPWLEGLARGDLLRAAQDPLVAAQMRAGTAFVAPLAAGMYGDRLVDALERLAAYERIQPALSALETAASEALAASGGNVRLAARRLWQPS